MSRYGEIPEHGLEIAAVIRQLPTRQAQVFALTYVSDLSVAQVAEILQVRTDTTKTHLRRARATLAARADLFADDRRAPPAPAHPDGSGTR